jgi:hypothetical protein
MGVLGSDCDRCKQQLCAAIETGKVKDDGSAEADYEFHARLFFRAVFAFIEAITFSVKVRAAAHSVVPSS